MNHLTQFNESATLTTPGSCRDIKREDLVRIISSVHWYGFKVVRLSNPNPIGNLFGVKYENKCTTLLLFVTWVWTHGE